MLGRSNIERRLNRNIYRRSEHVNKNPAFRLAGKIFSESSDQAQYRNSLRQAMQKSRPVGLGFAAYDVYGPDDNWSSQESLRDTHDRDHYIVGENHGFLFDSLE